ncbi:uncharacterized protein LOC142618522 [Castanea sativa]|uniref:uncharacterized protein LOC142618522 n=1 Tax=Castanea sativa TaxID=21020 RepID=UPI003F6498DB
MSMGILLAAPFYQMSQPTWSATRLKDMENTHNKCLQALLKSGAERIFEAYRWVQEHRNEFNKEVYGPVLLEGMSEDVSINKFFDEAMMVELAQQSPDLHHAMV